MDVPRLRHVHQRRESLAPPLSTPSALPGLAEEALTLLPDDVHRKHVFVASVDRELCASIMLRPQRHRFRWDVLMLAAGSPRLDADDDTCVELWSALLEFSIRQAGAAGAKRLFAAVDEGSAAHLSLRRSGFDGYTRVCTMQGRGPVPPVALPEGFREQDDSDVWSIHHLYHHVTPRVVQFAEARTSMAWELPRPSMFARVTARASADARAFVIDRHHDVQAFCRIQQHRGGPVAEVLVHPNAGDLAVPLVMASAAQAGLSWETLIGICIPAYLGELVPAFEAAGFVADSERVAMVRHTTAPAIIHARPAPLPVEVRERVPRGIVTLRRCYGESHRRFDTAVRDQ
jgi:hypothetical protein